jgi:hypothetical protein
MTYTPEKTQEVIERISELRSYWRRVVEAKMEGKSRSDETRPKDFPQGRDL